MGNAVQSSEDKSAESMVLIRYAKGFRLDWWD